MAAAALKALAVAALLALLANFVVRSVAKKQARSSEGKLTASTEALNKRGTGTIAVHEPRLVMLTLQNCPGCIHAKQLMKDNKLVFETQDLKYGMDWCVQNNITKFPTLTVMKNMRVIHKMDDKTPMTLAAIEQFAQDTGFVDQLYASSPATSEHAAQPEDTTHPHAEMQSNNLVR